MHKFIIPIYDDDTRKTYRHQIHAERLRARFATSLLAAVTDLLNIQILLRAKNRRMTEIFTPVSTRDTQKIKSPGHDY